MSDNLASYRKKRVENRLKIIEEELFELSKNKMSFNNITNLAKALASLVYKRELSAFFEGKVSKKPKPVSHTSLQRKESPYHSLLRAYQEKRLCSSGIIQEISLEDIKSLIEKHSYLKLFIAQKDLEISNLKTEISRLKNEKFSSQNKLNYDDKLNSDKDNILLNKIDLTVTSLIRLIEYIEYVEIDAVNKEIIDNTIKFGNKSIIDKKLLVPFFEHIDSLVGE